MLQFTKQAFTKECAMVEVLRLIIICSVTLALGFYGLKGATGTLSRLLVLTGVIALGLLSAKLLSYVMVSTKPRSTGSLL
jgi:hypothetical protein